MNCPKCNASLPEGSRFCEECGAKIEAAPQPVYPSAPAREPMDPDKKKKIIVIGAAVAVVILLAIILVSTHKTKIDMQKYTTVSFEGYDGYGTATLEFNSTKMWADIADATNLKSDVNDLEDIEDLEELIDSKKTKKYASLLALETTLDWSIDRTSDLKNGDTVKVTYKYDNEIAKKLKLKFVGKSMTVKVKGLEDIKELDAFENIKVEFSGTSPEAYANVTNESSDDALKSLYYKVEPSSGLKAGDTVKVTFDYDQESFTSQYGAIVKETEKEYTVENVDAYISKAEEIDDACLTGMKDQAKDTIDSYLANNKDNFTGSNVKYVGHYFLTRKEGSWGNYNKVYIVYSVKVKSKDKSFKPSTVYMPIEFNNVIKYADGTVYVDLNSTNILGSTDLTYGWFGRVSGYKKESDMKNELVTSKKAEYNDETVGGLK